MQKILLLAKELNSHTIQKFLVDNDLNISTINKIDSADRKQKH